MPKPQNRHERRASAKVGEASRSQTINISETKLVFPTDVKPIFSDGLLVQFTGEAVILSFLKAIATIQRADGRLPKASEIETRCVAQVATTPSQMAENLKVLNAQFTAFVSAQEDDVKKFLFEKAGLKEPK